MESIIIILVASTLAVLVIVVFVALVLPQCVKSGVKVPCPPGQAG